MLVEARGLEARYGDFVALQGVSFSLDAGEILAILGPNGSGKTTLFRLLLGLNAPAAGSIAMLGGRPEDALARIGATIEVPSLYGHLDAHANLEITAHLKGAPETDFEELLREVDLASALGPVRHFSLGMRQRLALAEALIGEPKLLILDEPTNGLDPEGIRWFRDWVLGAVAKRNLGVVLSSHILSEVQQLAQRILVLRRGRERFSGTVKELRGALTTRLRTGDLAATIELLKARGHAVEQRGEQLATDGAPPDLARLLVAEGHEVLDVGPLESSLEDKYLELVR